MTDDGSATPRPGLWPGWRVATPSTNKARDPSGRIKKAVENKRAAQLWVVERLAQLVPGALIGESDPKDLQVAVDKLVEEIKQGFVGQPMQWRRNFLASGLDRGRRELKWQVKVPQPVIRLRQRGSPLTTANFAHVARFRRLRGALLVYLKGRLAFNPTAGSARQSLFSAADRHEIDLGMLLLCSIAFGAVAERTNLKRITECIVAPDGVHVGRHIIWLEWSDSGNGSSDRWSRWIADPLSALLLARMMVDRPQKLNLPEAIADDPWPALRVALAELGLDSPDLPSSMRMLLEWGSTWNYRHLPPFLAEFASGRLPSANLPPHAWLRLIERRPVDFSPQRAAAPDVASAPRQPQQATSPGSMTPREATLALRQLLRTGINRRKFGPSNLLVRDARGRRKYPHKLAHLRTELRQFAMREDIPAIAKLLAGWVTSSVGRLEGQGSANRLPTTLRYLEAIDYELADVVGADDLIKLPTERLAEIYNGILGRSRTAQRRNFRAGCLARFHQYLAQHFNLDDDLDSLFDAVDLQGGVDANLITEREFLLVLDKLAKHKSEPRHTLAQVVAALKGYRAMLRRGEVRQLERWDIQGAINPQMRITPHRPDGLKTHNAIRRIPLHDLLLDFERAQLQNYLETIDAEWDDWIAEGPSREGAGSRGAAPLFPKPEDPTQVLPDNAIFDEVVAILQEITGDRSLRFHHLRHSGIHFLILALLEELVPGCLSWLMPGIDPDRLRELRIAIIGSDQMSKQHLWAVAVLAGHSSPEITLGSYFHLCDWLLYCATVPLAPRLIDEDLAALTGLSHDNVRQLRQRKEFEKHEWFPFLLYDRQEYRQHWSAEKEIAQSKQPTINVVPSATQGITSPTSQAFGGNSATPGLSSAAAIIAMLAAAHRSPESIGPISRRYNVTPEILTKFATLAEQLENIIGNSRLQRARRGQRVGALPSLGIGALMVERPLRRRDPIHSAHQKRVADQLFDALRLLASQDLGRFDDFATLYWRRRDFDRSDFRFGIRNEARRLVAGIRSLHSPAGIRLINESSIAFTIEAFVGTNATPMPAQKALWCEAVMLQATQLAPASKTVTKPQGSERLGYLRLSIGTPPRKVAPGASISKQSVGTMTFALDSAVYAATLCRLAGR